MADRQDVARRQRGRPKRGQRSRGDRALLQNQREVMRQRRIAGGVNIKPSICGYTEAMIRAVRAFDEKIWLLEEKTCFHKIGLQHL